MIRYKVVNENRGSCSVSPRTHKYYKKYSKGSIVEMTPGSFGLAVFNTRQNAESFRFRHDLILRVKPQGRALKRPKSLFLLRGLAASYRLFKKVGRYHTSTSSLEIPSGTLFYRTVKVLD